MTTLALLLALASPAHADEVAPRPHRALPVPHRAVLDVETGPRRRARIEPSRAEKAARAHRLRVAGEAVTAVGLVGFGACVVTVASIAATCEELGCLAQLGPLIGFAPTVGLTATGATMWGVGARREREDGGRFAVVPTVSTDGGGVAVAGAW